MRGVCACVRGVCVCEHVPLFPSTSSPAQVHENGTKYVPPLPLSLTTTVGERTLDIDMNLLVGRASGVDSQTPVRSRVPRSK